MGAWAGGAFAPLGVGAWTGGAFAALAVGGPFVYIHFIEGPAPVLVETVLNFEYPTEPEPGHKEPVPEKKEPGDIKFDEPPGREAPGG